MERAPGAAGYGHLGPVGEHRRAHRDDPQAPERPGAERRAGDERERSAEGEQERGQRLGDPVVRWELDCRGSRRRREPHACQPHAQERVAPLVGQRPARGELARDISGAGECVRQLGVRGDCSFGRLEPVDVLTRDVQRILETPQGLDVHRLLHVGQRRRQPGPELANLDGVTLLRAGPRRHDSDASR
jgi:hypothetical protein